MEEGGAGQRALMRMHALIPRGQASSDVAVWLKSRSTQDEVGERVVPVVPSSSSFESGSTTTRDVTEILAGMLASASHRISTVTRPTENFVSHERPNIVKSARGTDGTDGLRSRREAVLQRQRERDEHRQGEGARADSRARHLAEQEQAAKDAATRHDAELRLQEHLIQAEAARIRRAREEQAQIERNADLLLRQEHDRRRTDLASAAQIHAVALRAETERLERERADEQERLDRAQRRRERYRRLCWRVQHRLLRQAFTGWRQSIVMANERVVECLIARDARLLLLTWTTWRARLKERLASRRHEQLRRAALLQQRRVVQAVEFHTSCVLARHFVAWRSWAQHERDQRVIRDAEVSPLKRRSPARRERSDVCSVSGVTRIN